MNTSLATIFSLVLGSVMVIGGTSINVDKILKDAKDAANGANLHQLATVIEIYYLDHNHYPDAKNGEELVDTLIKENYIINRPLDSKVFQYQAKDNGQNYSLALSN